MLAKYDDVLLVTACSRYCLLYALTQSGGAGVGTGLRPAVISQ